MRSLRLIVLVLFCLYGLTLYVAPRVWTAAPPVTQGPSLCTITGYIFKPDGATPVAGATVRVVRAVKDGSNVLFSVSPAITTTDATGRFTITVPRGPNASVWISAPTAGFNVAAGARVDVPDAATATLQFNNVATSAGAVYATLLVPTKITIKQNGVAFATDIGTLDLSGFAALTESPTGEVNIAPLSVSTGTFETTLAVGYLLKGPSNDGLFRPSTGALAFPNSNLGIKNSDPQAELDVTGTIRATKITITTFTPTGTADSSGSTGDIRWDADFIYVKTAAGWRRGALSSF